LRYQAPPALRTRTTKRRIDINASNNERQHNKEYVVMIANLEAILSLLLPAAVVAGASTRQTSWHLC
jgi:hypothetical protein